MIICESFNDLGNWDSFEFLGNKKATDYKIIIIDSTSALQAISQSSASGLIHKRRFNANNYPVLAWRWRIENANFEADGREKEGDDYPLRIFIMFEDDSADISLWESLRNSTIKLLYGFEPPESSLSFVWTNKTYEEKYFDNPYSSNIKMIPITADQDVINRWAIYHVRIDSVFQNIFNRTCPARAALAIMSDTDNTASSAKAYLDFIAVGK